LVLCISPRNDVVTHLGTIDEMAQHISTMIPMQVLADIDNSRNPMQLTKERLERAATENQFMNGKIAAITVSLPERKAFYFSQANHVSNSVVSTILG
jgi:hypothetical protein